MHLLLTLASAEEERAVDPDRARYIASLDDLDEADSATVATAPIFTEELKSALKETACSLLNPQVPLPDMSVHCAEQLNILFAGATNHARDQAEQSIVTSTDNASLSRYYQERMRDTLLVRGGKPPPSKALEDIIGWVVQNTNTTRIGIFYYQHTFFFSEEEYLTTVFSAKIHGAIATARGAKLDRKELSVIMRRFLPETVLATSTEIAALVNALEGSGSDADLVNALIEAARQHSYLRALLDLPLPGLERCRSILLRILNNPKYDRPQTVPFRLQNMHRFSPQGLIDYLQSSLEKSVALYVMVQGKPSLVSVLDALKANLSAAPVYASLTAREIAFYATPDESYGLLHQAASLLEEQRGELPPTIDELLAIFVALRAPIGISKRSLGKLRTVTPQKLLHLFTEKLNSLQDKNERNLFRTNASTILAGLQKLIQSSLSNAEHLHTDDRKLLSIAATKGVGNASTPPVGWFVQKEFGKVLYTLDAQMALSLTKRFLAAQEEEKYNQPADLGDFPVTLLIGDVRLLTITGLLLQKRNNDARYFLERENELPPFSPLALKQWSHFVLENATADTASIIRESLLLDSTQIVLAEKDVVAVAQHVIDNLSVVSSKWPKEISRIQELIQAETPLLLLFEEVIFYNELDFWAAILEKRITKAQSVSDLTMILRDLLPEESFDLSHYLTEDGSDFIHAVDGADDSEGYETSIPFLNERVPTFSQISSKVLKESPTEVDMGWLYEQSRSFQPFFLLLVQLYRIHGITLPSESKEFLQRRLPHAIDSDRNQDSGEPEYTPLFTMDIDPRKLPLNRIGSIPPIYYDADYHLSEDEVIAAHLNSLLNPQTTYPYRAGFMQSDLIRLFSFGSLDAVRQMLAQALCCPFPEFPEQYPLATGLGLKNSWKQVLEIMGAFLRACNEYPELLKDLFRSCFPKEPPTQLERAWLDHSLAVMVLMVIWIKNKKHSYHEDHLTYALAGLWHNLGMIEFGGAFDPAKGNLKGKEDLFNEYLSHQRIGFDIFNAAWERWFPNDSSASKQKKAIGNVILYHHVKPRNSTENAIVQEIDELVAAAYIADSVAHATMSVLHIHVKGANFETIFERMLVNLSRSDGNKFHLPIKIREIFPTFCHLLKSVILQKARAA